VKAEGFVCAYFQDPKIERILILSGDHLYKMDFNDLIDFHVNTKAQITISCNPVQSNKINEYGIIGIEDDNKVKSFVEKTDRKEDVKNLEVEIDGEKSFLEVGKKMSKNCTSATNGVPKTLCSEKIDLEKRPNLLAHKS